jgi:hypothetical protein
VVARLVATLAVGPRLGWLFPVSALIRGDVPGRRRNAYERVGIGLLVLLGCALWVTLRMPTPLQVVVDADGAYQLTGARQIAIGEHPFVDWPSIYGPLVFYASYLFQSLFGQKLLGEMLLCIVGYACAYSLVYLNVRHLTGRTVLALACLGIALLHLPRFYKYYILLGPSLTLYCLYRWVDDPSWRRLALVGFAVALAGLYRQDFGAYAFLTAGVTVALASDTPRRSLVALTGLSAWVLAWASPWLIFLLRRRQAVAYVRDSLFGALEIAQGMALPVPLPDPGQALLSGHNLSAGAYVVWFALPIAALGLLISRWRDLRPGYRTKGLATTLLATLCLLQAVHRAEIGHLMQSLAASYVVLGFVASEAMSVSSQSGSAPVRAAGIGLALVLAMAVTTMACVRSPWWTTPSAASFRYLATFYNNRPDGFLRKVEAAYPGQPYYVMADRIRSITAPQEKILAVPFLISLYVLADRPFAGGHMALAPGFFSGDEDQRQLIDELQREGNRLIVEKVDGGYDDREDRRMKNFAPIFYEYLTSHYEPLQDPTIPSGYVFWVVEGGQRAS